MTGTQKLTVQIGEEGLEVGTLFFERRQGRETSTFRYAMSWLESSAAFARGAVCFLLGFGGSECGGGNQGGVARRAWQCPLLCRLAAARGARAATPGSRGVY